MCSTFTGFSAAHTTAKTGNGSYNSATNTTTLTVTDSSASHHLTETFKLTGDLSHSSWTVSDDHNGGVNIVDPPADDGSPDSDGQDRRGRDHERSGAGSHGR